MFKNSGIMSCAKRVGVYAYSVVFFVCAQGVAAYGKGEGNKEGVKSANTTSVSSSNGFQWKEHSKLSWEDFRGPVGSEEDESAAVTHCGIGFRTIPANDGGKPQVVVYNKFYTDKSWVRSDAKIPDILQHEQGHFDLCEIYTRILQRRVETFNFDVDDVRQALFDLYDEVNTAYEKRQQTYENETAHGTIDSEQNRWTDMIAHELSN